MSKYFPIYTYFKHLDLENISINFSSFEDILGFKLPNSAFKHEAWWSNDRTGSHIWATFWLQAGWESDELDLSKEKVSFKKVGMYELDNPSAIEGYLLDGQVLRSARSRVLVERRKIKDNYACQACGFRQKINETFIIDVHHLNPLSISGEVETLLEDLICLCPNCHRIAHLRQHPFSLNEIKQLLAKYTAF